MEKYLNCLMECQFFDNIPHDALITFLSANKYVIKVYSKDDIIANEEDDCKSLGIVVEGTINIQRIYPTGKTITINMLTKSNVFGEAVIFSSFGKYPASIVSLTDTIIMFIPRDEIIKLCLYDQRYLNNFLGTLSDKILMLNKKLKNLSYQTVRQKVVNYILEEYNLQNKVALTIPLSREHMAEYLDIPRPSLSRELAKLKNEGVIDFYRNSITINSLDKLEAFLF